METEHFKLKIFVCTKMEITLFFAENAVLANRKRQFTTGPISKNLLSPDDSLSR